MSRVVWRLAEMRGSLDAPVHGDLDSPARDDQPGMQRSAAALGGQHDPSRLRIVSLVPSLTELLFELGLGPHVVGRTGFCVHPREAVRAVQKVGGTKSVDIDAVLALSPTHLVVNVDENERPTVDRLARHIPHVVVTHPLRLQDNHALYTGMGEIFNRPREAAALSARLHEAQRLLAGHRTTLDVVYLIWKDPWMTVSQETYIADMLAQAGLRVMAPESSRRYPDIDWSTWTPWQARRSARGKQAPQVLLSSEPYRVVARHLAEFARDQAIDPARCHLVDGEMLSWYGPRAIEGVHYLAQLRAQIDEVAS